MENSGGFGMVLVVSLLIIALLMVVGFLYATFYKRASREVALVRTGMGKEKVVINGGVLVLPRIHQVSQINMKTMKIEVSRNRHEALTTKDRMRVDVGTEFFVRVAQNEQSIGIALQTLGIITQRPEELGNLIEGKFVDALRSVAAQMTMQDLHEKRGEFVRQVQEALSSDLEKNGLELEAVSLTRFDQTEKQYFIAENTFDAEGLTKLTEQTELRKQDRNRIERESEVMIAERNLLADKEITKVQREKEQLRLETQRQIEFSKNSQEAEIAKNKSEQFYLSEEARLTAEKKVEEIALNRNYEISKKKVEIETELKQKEINLQKEIEQTKINQEKEIEISRQQKAIEIAMKSEEEASASAKAEKARGEQVRASQEVITVELLAKANRQKDIEVIEAQTKAEKDAVALIKQSEARLESAKKEAEAIEIESKAKASAIKVEADALLAKSLAEAQGIKALNESENLLKPEILQMRVKLAAFDKLPAIIAETVKPLQNIESIKIVDVSGLNTNGFSGDGSVEAGSSKSLPEQVVDASLRGQVARPLIESLMGELDLPSNPVKAIHDLQGVVALGTSKIEQPQPNPKDAEEGKRQESNQKPKGKGNNGESDRRSS